jgi:RimJ/RimL family protein N-acetyltransferase
MSIAIGDRTNWGKGYGYEVAQLALAFAFDEINLHRVQATVFRYNERSIALFEKLGFRREGVYREFLQRDGKRHDMLLYGLLDREWREIAGDQ